MIRERDGRVYVGGPVTLENATVLLREMSKYIGREQRIIDFSEVTEIDSAAVSLMLELSRKARAAGGSVCFANLGDSITSLTDLYGVEDLIAPAGS